MKFGLPLGFAVYCMLKGYDAFPDVACYDDNNSWSVIGTKDNIPDILNEAKVGTDWMIKAVISASQVARDVGNGPTDHGPCRKAVIPIPQEQRQAGPWPIATALTFPGSMRRRLRSCRYFTNLMTPPIPPPA